jgi:hypothetical protein
MTNFHYEKIRPNQKTPRQDRRHDVGARFKKLDGEWLVSIPKKSEWVPGEGHTVYVRRKTGKYISVKLIRKAGEGELDTYWSFKSNDRQRSIIGV